LKIERRGLFNVENLKLRKKKVKGIEYYSLWIINEKGEEERVANVGNLKALRVKLVKAERFDKVTNNLGEKVTNLLE